MLSRIAAISGLITAAIIMMLSSAATPAGAQVEDTTYTAVTPCAVFDSRTTQGATGTNAGPYLGDKSGGIFTGTNNKTFQITGTFPAAQGGGNTNCNIPADAVAVHINIVAINPITAGNIVATDAGGTPPSGGIVNYQALTPGLNNSNASNIPLSPTGALDIYANCGANCSTPTVDVRGVVLGYYTPSDLEARVAQLEALLANVTRDTSGPNGTDRLLFTGMNLQIVDGTGNTGCTHANGGSSEPCNGQGNLIIGYNEDPDDAEQRTGTHSLILGWNNDWTACSNVVFGIDNTTSMQYATVTGGRDNTATALYSTVTGGTDNTAEGDSSTVTGGNNNTASALHSTVTGGNNNTTTGEYSSIAGGLNNTASGDFSSVSGGQRNLAAGDGSVVSGGSDRSTTGPLDWVAGSLFETS